jgi:hypothetical protein
VLDLVECIQFLLLTLLPYCPSILVPRSAAKSWYHEAYPAAPTYWYPTAHKCSDVRTLCSEQHSHIMAHYFGFISLKSFQPKGVRTIRVSRHSVRSKRIAVSQSVWSHGILLLAGQTFTPPTKSQVEFDSELHGCSVFNICEG